LRLLPEIDINERTGGDGFFDFPSLFAIVYPYEATPPMPATIEHFEKNFQYVKSIPTINKTGDMERYVSLTTDLTAFIETARDEFITGKRSFNDWNRYVQEVKALGSDEAVKYVQNWYDDYWKLAGK
jgi:putative aldouronate transport system substrate-binding protein